MIERLVHRIKVSVILMKQIETFHSPSSVDLTVIKNQIEIMKSLKRIEEKPA